MNRLILKVQTLLFKSTRLRTYILKSPSLQSIINNPKCIVLTRLEDVGDMLVFVPTLRALRHAYPNAGIHLITRSNLGFETIDGCPYVDEIIRLENTFWGKLKLIMRLRQIKPDIFIISTQCWGRVKWGFWGGAKVIVGHKRPPIYGKDRKVKLAGFITLSPEHDKQLSEAENNLKLAQVLGVKNNDAGLEYSWVSPQDEQYVNSLLAYHRLQNQSLLVALSPGTKRPAKTWYADRFAAVADSLIEKYGAGVIITGAATDEPFAARILSAMKHPAISFAGKTSLQQLPALIKKVNLLIAVDSSPTHFAAAAGAPYIALFGPGEFKKWRHNNNPAIQKNIRKPVSCAPCNREFCDKHICMKQISIEDVLAQAEKIIRHSLFTFNISKT